MYEIKTISENIINDIDLKKGIVVGYFSTFDIIDEVGDIMQKTAFNKTLADNRKKLHLLNHDPSKAIGVPDILEIDSKGLRFETNLMKKYNVENETISNTIAKDVLTMYAEGIITQHSIGYKAVQVEIIENTNSKYEFCNGNNYIRGYRTLKEVKLYEGSSLTVPAANPFTPFLGFKSNEPIENQLEIIQKQIQKLNKLTRKGQFSDEMFLAIDIAYKQLNEMLQQVPLQNNNTQQEQPLIVDTVIEQEAEKKSSLMEYLAIINNYIKN